MQFFSPLSCLTPQRIWWVLVLAVFPAHLFIQLSIGIPLISALAWFVGNAGEAVLGAICVRLFKEDNPFVRKRSWVIVFFRLWRSATDPCNIILGCRGCDSDRLGQKLLTCGRLGLRPTSWLISPLFRPS